MLKAEHSRSEHTRFACLTASSSAPFCVARYLHSPLSRSFLSELSVRGDSGRTLACKLPQPALSMLFVTTTSDVRCTVLSAACHSAFWVSARRRGCTGRCLFPALQTLSNRWLLQNCIKSDARGFETLSVGPDVAEDLMRPALDLQGPRHQYRSSKHFGCERRLCPIVPIKIRVAEATV